MHEKPVLPLLIAPLAATLGILTLAAVPTAAAQLSPATARAYEEYVAQAEAKMQRDYAPGGAFLWTDAHRETPDDRVSLGDGRVLVACVAGCDSSGVEAPGGLVHDWVGIVFVPGVTLAQTLSLVQDYDHARDRYAPNVIDSRLIARASDRWKVFLRLKQTDVLTVVFDTEYDIRYVTLSGDRAYGISHSTRIAQVENAGKSTEHELPPGEDQGFLWRLDSYWRFEEVGGGVYIQCEAISLTRDVPAGLGWVVKPFIKSIPAESLRFTLEATRRALLTNSPAAVPDRRKSPKEED